MLSLLKRLDARLPKLVQQLPFSENQFKEFAMSLRIAFALFLVLVTGCATGPEQYSGGDASQSGSVNVLHYSTIDDMERNRLCHDYSLELGC
jgi:hypothetical protein